jgi:DMSO reductase anchor subunit
MHPALSVIFFTSVSGIGYGQLFLAGLIVALDPLRLDPMALLLAVGLGSAFTLIGLMSSMLHLGQPQRAWRAFSQWRSSWLSREGLASVACFVPAAALYVLAWSHALELAVHQLQPEDAATMRVLGAVLAACSVLTVFCTARIYTSLKPIAAWHNAFVLPGYLLFALLGGGTWLWLLVLLAGGSSPLVLRVLPLVIAASAVILAWLKHAYWRFLDAAPHAATPESATGLGRFGRVRGVEAPHTEENYLTREMGFVIARKHASRLRLLGMLLFAAAPALLALIACAIASAAASLACAIFAALAVTAGTFVERWLFFAQAKHAVMSYYAGARA